MESIGPYKVHNIHKWLIKNKTTSGGSRGLPGSGDGSFEILVRARGDEFYGERGAQAYFGSLKSANFQHMRNAFLHKTVIEFVQLNLTENASKLNARLYILRKMATRTTSVNVIRIGLPVGLKA